MELKTADFKNIAKDIFYYTGMYKLSLQASRLCGSPALLILTYHRVYPADSDYVYLGVSRDVFDQHMKFVKDNFKAVSMQEGIKALYGSGSREIYAAINLDDGYMDNYTNAFPVLRKYNMPATIFLTTDLIGKYHTFWWDKVFDIVSQDKFSSFEAGVEADRINKALVGKNEEEAALFIQDMKKRHGYADKHGLCRMLGWQEIKEMNRCNISFGAHTKTHRNLCLPKDKDALEELRGSKNTIEDGLGTEASGFSYPFGVFDQRIKALVKEAGFKYARANFKSFNYKDSDPFLLSCIGAGAVLKPGFLAARLFSAYLAGQGRRTNGY